MGGTFMSGRFGQRIGMDRMSLAGAAIATASGAVMAAFAWAGETHIETVVIPQVVAMLGVGLVFPNCQAGSIGPLPTMAVPASSLLGFSQIGVAPAVGLGTGHSFAGLDPPMAPEIAQGSYWQTG